MEFCVTLFAFFLLLQIENVYSLNSYAASATDPVVLTSTYQSVLQLAVTKATSNTKILLSVNIEIESNLNQLSYLTLFRGNTDLSTTSLRVFKPAGTNPEAMPGTFSFLDDDTSAVGTFIYHVKVLGSGTVSNYNVVRQLIAIVVPPTIAVGQAKNSSPLVSTTTWENGGTDVIISLSPYSSVMLLSTCSIYNPGEASITLFRDGADLAVNGLGMLLVARTSGVTSGAIAYMDRNPYPGLSSSGSTSIALYSLKFQAGASVSTYNDERSLIALEVPAALSADSQVRASNVFVTTTLWTDMTLTATVVSSDEQDNVWVSFSGDFWQESAGTMVAAVTLFRDGVNLGDDTYGVHYMKCETINCYRSVAFSFLDSPAAASGAPVAYSVKARVVTGSSFMIARDTEMSLQAILLSANDGLTPSAAPVFAPTLAPTISPYLESSKSFRPYNMYAFAAVNLNGTLRTWGAPTLGGNLSMSAAASPHDVVASGTAFAAHVPGQGIVAWGRGGVRPRLPGGLVLVAGSFLDGTLVSNAAAFAAITVSGAVVAFGDAGSGGNVTDDNYCNGFASQLSSNIVSITASSNAFAALTTSGSVYAWGSVATGGGVSSATLPSLTDVVRIFATRTAFAALTSSGSVVAWGDPFGGGSTQYPVNASAALSSNVVHIVGSKSAFVAIKSDGAIVTWGHPARGGDSSSVPNSLRFQYVTFNDYAFAGITSSAEVVAWGGASGGGSSAAAISPLVAQGESFVSVAAAGSAFAAVTAAGAVVAWGNSASGGLIPPDVSALVASGVVSVQATRRAFAALKADGSVVTWGNPQHGGNSAAVAAHLTSGVVTVCANEAAFTAIKSSGSAVLWGHGSITGPLGDREVFEADTRFAGVTQCI
jgi:alpha-tubulin suppressor-like RCC1 family protein